MSSDEAFFRGMLDSLRDLMQSGLTAVSPATLERLHAGFKQAAQGRHLRLSATLRQLSEEVARFESDAQEFSKKRFMFFLNRSWVLTSAMLRALGSGEGDAPGPPKGVEFIDFAVRGVLKRHAPGRFCSFEFRLHCFASSDPDLLGQPLSWSCVFPLRKGLEVPPEALLELNQKQSFRPSQLLGPLRGRLTKVGVAPPPPGTPSHRVSLGPASAFEESEATADFVDLTGADFAGAANRIAARPPSPLELEIERIEEYQAKDYGASDAPPEPNADGAEGAGDARWWPWILDGLPVEVRIEPGGAGDALVERLVMILAKDARPPLFGLLHYEACRIAFQPLTLLTADGPNYLTLREAKISKAELLGAMNFV